MTETVNVNMEGEVALVRVVQAARRPFVCVGPPDPCQEDVEIPGYTDHADHLVPAGTGYTRYHFPGLWSVKLCPDCLAKWREVWRASAV